MPALHWPSHRHLLVVAAKGKSCAHFELCRFLERKGCQCDIPITICAYIYVYICMYIYIYIYVCVYVCVIMCVCVYDYVCMCVYVCMYVYTYTESI